MDNFISEIRECPLIMGIAPNQLGKVFECMVAKRALYKKGDAIVKAGDKMDFIGWILNGSVLLTYDDIDGNIAIIGSLSAPELFGETLIYTNDSSSPLSIHALEDCELLLIKFSKLKSPCKSMCTFHLQVTMNILHSAASKMLHLLDKVLVISNQTIRQRILCFLNIMKEQNGAAKKFTIPYNREQMSKYLCVNQSALSTELRKMSDEGLLRFKRNEFELL
ncbi:MAG: Crp/Fnr family transcriptional regulator [Firmicutes bacterium]|nr:Crp/Fnr family transcriptional regulator [Bacillota bacterium]